MTIKKIALVAFGLLAIILVPFLFEKNTPDDAVVDVGGSSVASIMSRLGLSADSLYIPESLLFFTDGLFSHKYLDREVRILSIRDAALANDRQGVLVKQSDESFFVPLDELMARGSYSLNFSTSSAVLLFDPLSYTLVAYNLEKSSFWRPTGLSYDGTGLFFDETNQSLRRVVSGESLAKDAITGALPILDVDIVSFAYLAKKYPNASVLSVLDKDELVSDDALVSPLPYQLESLPHQVSMLNSFYTDRKLVYVIPYRSVSIALDLDVLQKEKRITQPIYNVTLEATLDGDEVRVRSLEEEIDLPGYYSQWFGWITRFQENGIIWHKSVDPPTTTVEYGVFSI